MVSIQHILENTTANSVNIIFGNQGRSPRHLFYILDECFPDKIVQIQSPYYFKMYPSYEDEEKYCDVLVLLEPTFGYDIVKPHYVDRLIVFTSHLSFCKFSHYKISSHHVGNAEKNPRNWLGYESEVDKRADIVIKPNIFYNEYVSIPKDNTIWIDLTDSKTAHEAFLRLLNARDVLVQEDTHDNWIVALSSDMKQEMKNHLEKTNECLNNNYLMENNTDGIVKLKKIYTSW